MSSSVPALIMEPAAQIKKACEALRRGHFVIIHDFDDREDEVDMVVAAEAISPEHIKIMREDAGGLICQSIRHDLGCVLGLPYLSDVLSMAAGAYPVLATLTSKPNPYGGKPAFSVTVNHRSTYTGITDNDRAKTIREVASLCRRAIVEKDGVQEEFSRNFRSPGHVHILLASEGLLQNRTGHTELSVYLLELAGLTPTATICEMLDGKKYRALSVQGAKAYAEKNGYPFLEGKAIQQHFLGLGVRS